MELDLVFYAAIVFVLCGFIIIAFVIPMGFMGEKMSMNFDIFTNAIIIIFGIIVLYFGIKSLIYFL
jgi:hypothetical protein